MKKFISVILLISIISLIFTGCGSSLLTDSEFQIKVSGTTGLKFSGNYMVVTSGGKSTSQSVDGVVPTQYSVKGSIVSAVFQKQVEGGSLKVEIWQGGKVVNEATTSAAYGVVSVATN